MLKVLGTGAAVVAATGAKVTAAEAKPLAPSVIHAAPTAINLLCQTAPQTESLRRTGQIFQQQTGIGVNITEVPYNSLQPKMMTELIAGSGKYDVFPITNAMMYPAAQYLADISAMLTPDLRKDLSPGSIDSCRDLAGVLRALPLENSLPANFYRTDIYKQHGLKPPTTWEEYLAVCQATTQASRRVYGTLIEASAAATQPAIKLLGWFYQNGGHFADKNGKPTVNLPENVEALQFIVDLVHKYKVAAPQAAEMTFQEVHTQFIEGRGASAINWQYMVSLASDPKQSVVVGKFAVAPVPMHKIKAVNIDTWMLVIPNSSKNKDAAMKYVDLVLSTDRQIDLLKSEGLVARFSAMDPKNPKVLAANPFIAPWLEEMKWAVAQPKWNNLGETFFRLSAAMSNAVTLSMTPKAALDQAQKEIVALVEKK